MDTLKIRSEVTGGATRRNLASIGKVHPKEKKGAFEMTREEILAMKPGRELDVLMAEKVMGLNGEHDWIKDKDGEIDIFAYESGYCNGPKCSVCGYEYCHHCHKEPPIEKCNETKAYSSNIAAAWEVFGKIKDTGAWIEVAWNPKRKHYRCAIGAKPIKELQTVDLNGCDNAPEAICKAALLAVMEVE